MECSRVFHSVTVEGFRNSTIYNSYALHINWKEQNDGNLQKWVSSTFPLLLNYFAGCMTLFPRFSFSNLKLVKMWITCNNYYYWCQMSDFKYITHQVGNQVPSSLTNTIQQLYCYRLGLLLQVRPARQPATGPSHAPIAGNPHIHPMSTHTRQPGTCHTASQWMWRGEEWGEQSPNMARMTSNKCNHKSMGMRPNTADLLETLGWP